MIPSDPLPKDWAPERDLSFEEGSSLDQILFGKPTPEPPHDVRARWSVVRNEVTGERAWLRVHNRGEAKITGLIFTPESMSDRLVNRSIRSIPLAAIELAVQEDSQRGIGLLKQRLFHGDEEWSPLEHLGNPREVEHFYDRVALQFLELKKQGADRPVARMAEINARPIKTVQGWVTEARKRRLLPPGKPGRAG